MAAGMVVVFDFDKTIIACDSDNWVVDELGVKNLFTRLLPTMPWNPLMDRMMAELHVHGKTIEDISECLKRVPIHAFGKRFLDHKPFKLLPQGLVMGKIQASVSSDGKKHFIYIGDGASVSSDGASGLKLEEGDFLLPRKNYPIWDLISANPLLTKAAIYEGNECDELGTILLNTMKALVVEDKSGRGEK